MDDDRDITRMCDRIDGYREAIRELVRKIKTEGEKSKEEALSFCEWIFPYDPNSYIPRLTKDILTKLIDEVYNEHK